MVGVYYALSKVIGLAWALWLLVDVMHFSLPVFNCMAAAATFSLAATTETQEEMLQSFMAKASDVAHLLNDKLRMAALAIASGTELVTLHGLYVTAYILALKGIPLVVEVNGVYYRVTAFNLAFEVVPRLTGVPVVLALIGLAGGSLFSGGILHVHRRFRDIYLDPGWLLSLSTFDGCPDHEELLELLTAGKRKGVSAGGAGKKQRADPIAAAVVVHPTDQLRERALEVEWRDKVGSFANRVDVSNLLEGITPEISFELAKANTVVLMRAALEHAGVSDWDSALLVSSQWFCKEALLNRLLKPHALISVLVANDPIRDGDDINATSLGISSDTSSVAVAAAASFGLEAIGVTLVVFESALTDTEYPDKDEDERFFAFGTSTRYIPANERALVRCVIWSVLLAVAARRGAKVVVFRHMLGDELIQLDFNTMLLPDSAFGALSPHIGGGLPEAASSSARVLQLPGSGHFGGAGEKGSDRKAAGPLLLLQAAADAMTRHEGNRAAAASPTTAVYKLQRAAMGGAAKAGELPLNLRLRPRLAGLFNALVVNVLAEGGTAQAVGAAAKAAVAQNVAAVNTAKLATIPGAADLIAAVKEAAQRKAAPCATFLLPDIATGVPNKAITVESFRDILVYLCQTIGLVVPLGSTVEDIIASIGAKDLTESQRSGKEASPGQAPDAQLLAWCIKQGSLPSNEREDFRDCGLLYVTLKHVRANSESASQLEAIYPGTTIRKGKTAPQAGVMRFGERDKAAEQNLAATASGVTFPQPRPASWTGRRTRNSSNTRRSA